MFRSPSFKRAGSFGFSLAEVMASILVLTLTVFAVLGVNAITLRQTRYNEGLQTASSIAASTMSLVESVLKVDFKTDPSNISTQVLESPDFKGFKFQVVDGGFVSGSDQKLRTVSVGVSWTDEGIDRRYQIDTTFYDY